MGWLVCSARKSGAVVELFRNGQGWPCEFGPVSLVWAPPGSPKRSEQCPSSRFLTAACQRGEVMRKTLRIKRYAQTASSLWAGRQSLILCAILVVIVVVVVVLLLVLPLPTPSSKARLMASTTGLNDGKDETVGAIAVGFSLGFGFLTVWEAVKQTRRSKNPRRSPYIAMVWGELLANLVILILGFLFFKGVLTAR